MTNLLVIEDHPLTAMIAEEIVVSAAEIKETRYIHSLAELGLIDPLDYGIVVTDLMLPETIPEVTLQTVNAIFSHAHRFVFTAMVDSAMVAKIEYGGAVYLCKNQSFKEIMRIVHKELCGGNFEELSEVGRRHSQSLIRVPGKKPLSSKQAAVIELIAQGNSIKEAARITKLSPETVKAHIREAFVRLGAHNGREASTRYIEARRLAERVYGKRAVELSIREQTV